VRVDLHCHSTCSDGTDGPEIVGALARDRAVELFALTDHDTCAGSAAAATARGPGVVLRGVEISCHDGKHTIHVLAYDTGGPWHELEARLDEMREARRRRIRVIAAKLAQRGVHLDVDPLLAAAGTRSVGRPDVARAMVEQGIVASMNEAFDRWLHDGGPGDAGGHRLELADALALGRAVGARMALAHPHQVGDRAAGLLRRHKADGLSGIEVFYGPYDVAQRGRWLKVADQLGLVCTGGSDRHTAADRELGVELPDERVGPLRDWLGV
jgi:predicted metal-dependent phosphoesterase TrpH